MKIKQPEKQGIFSGCICLYTVRLLFADEYIYGVNIKAHHIFSVIRKSDRYCRLSRYGYETAVVVLGFVYVDNVIFHSFFVKICLQPAAVYAGVG